MRLLPALLLLAAAPAFAQQEVVDPDLIGTWTLDAVEEAPTRGVKVVSMTLTISADGRLVAKMLGVGPDGTSRSETEEEQVTTANGQIDDGRSPINYVLLDPDTLRLSDDRLSLRFRRTGR